jgi:hypothetical protein
MLQPKPGSERWTFQPLGGLGGGVRLAYWDVEAYCKTLVVEGAKGDDIKAAKDQAKVDTKTTKKKLEKSTGEPEKPKKRKAEVLTTKEETNPSKKVSCSMRSGGTRRF